MVPPLSYLGLATRGQVPVSLRSVPLETFTVAEHIRHRLYSIKLVVLWLEKPSKLRKHRHSFSILRLHGPFRLASPLHGARLNVMTFRKTSGVFSTTVSVGLSTPQKLITSLHNTVTKSTARATLLTPVDVPSPLNLPPWVLPQPLSSPHLSAYRL